MRFCIMTPKITLSFLRMKKKTHIRQYQEQKEKEGVRLTGISSQMIFGCQF